MKYLLVVLIIVSLGIIRASANYCYRDVTCHVPCTKVEKTKIDCGFLGWVECSKYRIVTEQCVSTCEEEYCCDGYTGNGCSSPICTTPCRNGGLCIDPDTCSCPVGFGTPYCDDVDECSDNNNGGCSDICENTPGSYNCGCGSGYSLNDDGQTCSDIDECNADHGECDNDCTNTQGSYTCSCTTGYYIDLDGHSCKDIDECILTFNGGCQDTCLNTPGSFLCSCHDGSPINTDGKTCASSTTTMTVFQRHGIIRKLLPRGCSTLSLINCDQGNNPNILLTSTSPWYQLRNDSNVLYTVGTVFVETGIISLPISISGVTVLKSHQHYSMSIGPPTYTTSAGNLQQRIDDEEECLSVDFTVTDMNEFVQSNSFLNSFFDNINEIIPDWLSFTLANQALVSYSNFDSYMLYGQDIDDNQWCRGAPVESSHLYHVLLYDEHLQLTVYGDEITLPKLDNAEKVCFIIDLCQESGTTFFVILPKTLRTFLSNLQLFQALTKNDEVQLLVRGFGLSINRQINVNYPKNSMTFWNGDHVFEYPVFENANIWLGADYRLKLGILELSGNSDLFIGLPSIKNILVATFKEEWNILFDLTVSAQIRLEFKLFGEDVEIILPEIGGLEFHSYASLGGFQERRFCGREANPPGLFFSLTFKVNPFSSIPVLRDWNFDLGAAEGYLFVVKEIDNTTSIVSLDITPILLELWSISQNLTEMTTAFLNSQLDLLTAHTIRTLVTLNETLNQFLSDLQTLIDIHDLAHTDLTAVLDAFGDVWSHSWTAVKREVRTFLDSVEFNVKIFHTHLTDDYNTHLGLIEDGIEEYIEKVTSIYTNSFKQLDGYGIHAYVDIMIYSLKIPKVTIELVYSVDSLGACSRYTGLYKIFENREALRVYGEISDLEIKIGKFLQLDDTGFGAAFSVDEAGLFLIQIHVKVSLLEIIPISTDLFINNNGIYLVFETNMWNLFPAQLTVSAELGKEWSDLTFSVIGKFFSNSDNDDSFGESYMSAFRKRLNDIGTLANDRLTDAQARLTKANNILSKAQSWLEKKQDKLSDANTYFDNAVADLESAKEKIDAAKAAFERALDRLRQAQRDVDNLCRIQTCRTFCIPGLRFKLCKGWWGVRYPCPEWTSCLFRLPDPICVSKNAFCRIIRGAAYLVLEAAKLFVRTAMLAMDAAKAILSEAQFVVDKSRVVLDIASVLVDIAQNGLEATKRVLEIANIALEGVKLAVRIGLKVYGWIIQYQIQSLIDVRNCQFEARIKTTDLPILSVECQIKLFGFLDTDWRSVKFKVVFKRLLQSLWETAKALIEQGLLLFGDLFGRKRRDIAYSTKHLTYKIIRETRDADISLESFNSTINETFFSLINNVTNDYDYRVLIFAKKCNSYKNVFAFLNESVFSLLEMTNATASALKENGTSSVNDILNYEELQQNMTLDNMGIDLDVASDEYNITSEDMQVMLSNFTNDFGNDSLIQEISQLSNTINELQGDQIESTDNSNMVEIWILAMENSTGQYFDNNTCASFIDCVHHSLFVMYDIFYEEDTVNTTIVYEAISQIEDAYLELFGNETSIILDMNNAAEKILAEMITIDDICPFCYSAPTLSSPFANVSVEIGKDANIICDVMGDPEPTIWWFKNEDFLQNETSTILAVKNVTGTDGAYQCVAGNAVANLSTPEVFVNIMVEEKQIIGNETVFEDKQKIRNETEYMNLIPVIIATSSVAGVIVIGIVLMIFRRLYVRNKIPSCEDLGSVVSLNDIRPVSGQSPVPVSTVSEF